MTSLNLYGCSSLTALPAPPAGMTSLNLANCSNLTALPALPDGLRELNLHGCYSLTALPDPLPAGLESLNLSNHSNLTALPALPDGITDLNLYGCSSLTELPNPLPTGLMLLHLQGCRNLPDTPELRILLENLLTGECDVQMPAHWIKASENSFIRTIAAVYQTTGQQQTPAVRAAYQAIDTELGGAEALNGLSHLVYRNLHENAAVRGGLRVIAQNMIPTLEVLARTHTQSLHWVREEAAKTPSGSCVNQPVATWARVALGLSVFEAALATPNPHRRPKQRDL